MIEWLVNKRWFRNANHAIWFVGSVGILGFIIAQKFVTESRWLLAIPTAVHFSPFLTSITKIYYQKQQSDVYSKDCIWFNGLMILAYVILMLRA